MTTAIERLGFDFPFLLHYLLPAFSSFVFLGWKFWNTHELLLVFGLAPTKIGWSLMILYFGYFLGLVI